MDRLIAEVPRRASASCTAPVPAAGDQHRAHGGRVVLSARPYPL